MKIIGLAGKAGAGKDYAFNYIRTVHADFSPFGIVLRVAFADGVREEIADVLQTDTDVLWTKPYSEDIRRLLQWWGTELRRAQDPDYWVKKGIAEAQRLAAGPNVHLVVLTDVRFANEAEIIQKAGGLVFEVIASNDLRRKRLGGVLPPAHASEEIDFEVDAYIQNTWQDRPPLIPRQLYNYCGGGSHG